MSDTFPLEAAEKLFEAVESAGLSRSKLCAAAGIGAGDGRLSYRSLCALYEAAARLTGDGAFGLRVGTATSAGMYGRLGYIATHSPNLGAALAEIVRYQRLWSTAAGVALRRGRDRVALRYWQADSLPARDRRQECEQMLATLVTFLADAAGPRARPIEVRFEHRMPEDVSAHRHLFGDATLVFAASHTALILAPQALDAPLAAADPRLGALIRDGAEAALSLALARESLSGRVRAALAAAFVEGRGVGMKDIARQLSVAPRTLQRRLQADGSTFTRLLGEARTEAAAMLLDEGRQAISQIAHRLGFSQPSAFHRAFRRATGMTPRRYRERSDRPD